ncbi:hypothetical protein Tco_1092330 [Tanacetum coccineum]|uniref:Uncharacterized protein n=1 Tax=Tanacetum coccineum TaxID=301880 RepID=A0ABQ5I9J3_9ASTR
MMIREEPAMRKWDNVQPWLSQQANPHQFSGAAAIETEFIKRHSSRNRTTNLHGVRFKPFRHGCKRSASELGFGIPSCSYSFFVKGIREKDGIRYVVPDTRQVSVLDGAFGGVGDEEVVVGEGVVVISSSLEMLTNSCLGGIMVSLIFLEGFEEEAFVEFMVDFG